MKLTRYTDTINWSILSEMKRWLYSLVTDDVTIRELEEAAEKVAAFQEENGEFAFCRDPYMPGDAYADLVNYATCLFTAVLIRFVTKAPERIETFRSNLNLALEACAKEGLFGHGYDSYAHEEHVIDLFRRAGCSELMRKEPQLCPEFSALWHKLNGTLLLVYGTLRRGERNHHYMEGCTYLGEGVLQNYETMDYNQLPGIRRKEGSSVVGEVYRVPTAIIPWIDQLEGEGTLYKRTPITINQKQSFSSFPGVVYVPIDNNSCHNAPIMLQLVRVIKGIGKVEARGYQATDGFVVKSGSKVSPTDDDSIPVAIKKRRAMVWLDENHILKEDQLFSSPSYAAMFVIGKSANGLTSWKNTEGRTLKSLKTQQ